MAKTFNPTNIAHRIRQSENITFEMLADECGMPIERFHQSLKVRLGSCEYGKLVKRERQNHTKNISTNSEPSVQWIKVELERRSTLRTELEEASNRVAVALNESSAVVNRILDELREAQEKFNTAKRSLNELQAETKQNEESIAKLELQLEALTKHICFADYDGPINEGYIKAGSPREQVCQISSLDPKVFSSDVSFASVIQAVNDVNFALVYIKDHPEKTVNVLCGPVSATVWQFAKQLL